MARTTTFARQRERLEKERRAIIDQVVSDLGKLTEYEWKWELLKKQVAVVSMEEDMTVDKLSSFLLASIAKMEKCRTLEEYRAKE